MRPTIVPATTAAVRAAAADAGKSRVINDFESLGVGGTFRRALRDKGYTEPTPIQSQAIPQLLRGKDLLGIAQTGTGKTAAFALPLLQRLDEENSPPRPRRPRALVLAPTRELALQIHEELTSLGRYTKMRHAFIIGGVSQNPQIKGLAQGLDVLVATPGRLLDLAGQRHVDLSEVSVLVLDEADRLLDMGFIRDVKRIVALTPKSRQSLLFSATMPKEVAALARELLEDPIRVDVSPKQMTVKEIDQRVVMVDNIDKQRMLEHLLRDDEVSRAIVFTRTKHGANKVARKLENAGIGAEAIHGNKSQNARQRALRNFKNGDAWVLVATDIAARGIDIDAVSHVFNYELPHEPESYVHRIGRTARAGATGAAWSLVDPSERSRLRAVERLIKSSPAEVAVDLPPRDPAELSQASRRPPQSSGRPPANQRSGARRRTRRRRRQPAA
ncbi:MAG: ATP-dependent helicase [Deltaproteobacteria bacterium]|nr:MAG: ATP-dependent helicase [Deltaproteobacteria bacterium]